MKARLREYARQVTSGEMEFSTLAILYSEDPGSSVNGGVVGFRSRAELLPEYANAAFNLKDTKKVSNIVETEDGYHIIQLIEKRGERINTRHILCSSTNLTRQRLSQQQRLYAERAQQHKPF